MRRLACVLAVLACCVPMRFAHAQEETAANRIEGRSPDLWRYYMHGVVDDFAAAIDVTALADEHPALTIESAVINTPHKNWEGPCLRFDGAFGKTLPRPLPLPIDTLRGSKVRLFFWERGDNTGRENTTNSYGDAPNLLIICRDGDGKTIATHDTFVKTTGTFPWHCYYDDMFVPDGASGLYLRFSNPRGGTVRYAAFSWEPITQANTYSKADCQDPLTGSLTYNPDYDALNWHLNRGMATRYTWNFFRGASAGLIGQPYDVTTREGLRRYFFEKAKTDNDHLNHSLMYFASRYHYGKAAGVLPEGMDDAWLASLAELVINDQDPGTGYWGTNHTPLSMGITFHLTEGLFNYHSIPRTDRADSYNETRHMGIKEIPRAGRIIETTLRMQCTTPGPDGQPVLAGWPHHAYNFTDAPNKEKDRCSLVVTSNAIWMMTRCERFVDAPARRRVHESVRAAVGYVLDKCVLPDGTWVQSDTETAPSTASYMKHIVETSHYLERKRDPAMPAPRVEVADPDNGGITVSWSPRETENSLRMYAAPPDVAVDAIDESRLIGIIHRTGHRVRDMDPLIAVRAMSEGARKRWGSGWTSKDGYLGWKINEQTPESLALALDAAPLTIPAADIEGKTVYVSAVTWYGEESTPLPVYEP